MNFLIASWELCKTKTSKEVKVAFSFYEDKGPVKVEEFEVNRYLTHKFDKEHIVVTTDHGGWVCLNKEEFDLLRYNKIREDPQLYKLLEEKGVIITLNNIESITRQLRNKFAHVSRGAGLHIITVTLRCNHTCVYCHAKSKPLEAEGYDMSKEDAKKVVEFLFESPARDITIEFQGGEPLLNFPVIKYIYEYSQELNKRYNKKLMYIIVTNAVGFTDEIKDYMKKNNIRFCSSLDGPKKLHDKQRKYFGHKSSYDEVIKKFKELKKDFNFSALPTITKESLNYPREIIDEYLKNGFSNIMSRNLNFAGFAKQLWEQIGYSSEEFLEFWKKVFDYELELNKKGKKFLDSKIQVILWRLLTNRTRGFTCFGSPCGALIGQISYDYNGDIYTCDESRSFDIFKMGNVNTHSYKDIMIKAKDIVSLTSGFASMCDACPWHPYCGTCMVATYGAQGSVVPKLAVDHECKIRKGMIEYIFKKILYSKEDRDILLGWAGLRKTNGK